MKLGKALLRSLELPSTEDWLVMRRGQQGEGLKGWPRHGCRQEGNAQDSQTTPAPKSSSNRTECARLCGKLFYSSGFIYFIPSPVRQTL